MRSTCLRIKKTLKEQQLVYLVGGQALIAGAQQFSNVSINNNLQMNFIQIYYCLCMLYHLLSFLILYVFLLRTSDYQRLCPLVCLLLPWLINRSISVPHICFLYLFLLFAFYIFLNAFLFLDIRRLLFSC